RPAALDPLAASRGRPVASGDTAPRAFRRRGRSRALRLALRATDVRRAGSGGPVFPLWTGGAGTAELQSHVRSAAVARDRGLRAERQRFIGLREDVRAPRRPREAFR